MRALVAVTGASGFVGRAVSRRLLGDGHTVRALIRNDNRAVATGADPTVVADHSDLSTLRRAITGCDCVFHLAGVAHQADNGGQAAATRFRDGIVTPTAGLLDAMKLEDVRCLVMVSSIAAVCTTNTQVITDATPAQPTSAYGRAKLEADQLALERAGGSRLSIVVLRPPALYGPGMKGNPLRLFNLVSRGIPLPVGAIHNRRSMMFVDNFAAACAEAWLNTVRGTFVVADRPAHSTGEWARLVALALGVPSRIVAVPSMLLRLGAHASALGVRLGFEVGFSQLDRLLGSVEVLDDGFRAALPYPLPTVSEAEALALTAAWYKESLDVA